MQTFFPFGRTFTSDCLKNDLKKTATDAYFLQ